GDGRADPDRHRRGQRGLSRGARAAPRAAQRSDRRRVGRRRRAGGLRLPAAQSERGVDGLSPARPRRDRSDTRVARRVPDRRGRRAHRVGEPGGDGGAEGGRRRRVPHEGPGARRDRRRDSPRGGRVNLTAANTAIVVDSTADFPEAHDRFVNWRTVPLYVRFGDESRRDYVEMGPEEFYARLRTATELPTTSQPTPGDFLAAYEELGAYERIYSLHISAKLSGTFESARTAAAQVGERVRVVDTETASAAIAMLGLAVQRRLERGTT